MRVLAWSMAAMLALAVPASADGPQGKLVDDLWDVAYLEGARAGYVHTQIRAIENDGKTYYTTVMALNLTVKRNSDVIQLRMDTGNTETASGQVLGTFMRQYLGKNKTLLITGICQ